MLLEDGGNSSRNDLRLSCSSHALRFRASSYISMGMSTV